MRSRVEALLRNGTRGMWVGTFHGLAHRLLRLHWREAQLPEAFQVMAGRCRNRCALRGVQLIEQVRDIHPAIVAAATTAPVRQRASFASISSKGAGFASR
jgi:superfamily I DNA/RNA helicase